MTAIKANDFNGQEKEWCPGADLNHRHEDFQSTALPTELPGHRIAIQSKSVEASN
jgi:hypothetical protein